MGYTTEFKGSLQFDKPLTPEQVEYIQAFNQTRRMKRDAQKAETLTDQLRHTVGLPIGEEGAYYVGSHSDGDMGQKNDHSILDYNTPPGQLEYGSNFLGDRYKENKQRIEAGKCQPGLWCQWTVSDDGKTLEWDGGEKFYYYTDWLKYLITHFFDVWGVKLNGQIKWRGEYFEDTGTIFVENSNVTSKAN